VQLSAAGERMVCLRAARACRSCGGGWDIVRRHCFTASLMANGALKSELREGSGIDGSSANLGVQVGDERIDMVGACWPCSSLYACREEAGTRVTRDAISAARWILGLSDGRSLALEKASIRPRLADPVRSR